MRANPKKPEGNHQPLPHACACPVNTHWWHNGGASHHRPRAGAPRRLTAPHRRPQGAGTAGRGPGQVSPARWARPGAALLLRLLTTTGGAGPAPRWRCGLGPVTVPPGVHAHGFLGGVFLCCGMRSIRAEDPPPPTLWCCQWCNAEFKGRWVRILLPKQNTAVTWYLINTTSLQLLTNSFI